MKKAPIGTFMRQKLDAFIDGEVQYIRIKTGDQDQYILRVNWWFVTFLAAALAVVLLI